MKVPTVSTLWDYINRAMPWTQPKSLTADEVYAVTAFMLNLGGVVPDDFTLSDQNMAEVQKQNAQPQRHDHRARHVAGQGTRRRGQARRSASACMSNCAPRAQDGLASCPSTRATTMATW
jgi:hypothetical protein